MALFIAEVLYRTLKEEEANPDLFTFLENSLRYFEMAEEGIANFHIYIMLHLTRFLGFFPVNNHQKNTDYFDMRSGHFTATPSDFSSKLEPSAAVLLSKLMNSNLQEAGSIPLNRNLRNSLLESLLEYYSIHLPGMGEIRSYAVLKDIFDS